MNIQTTCLCEKDKELVIVNTQLHCVFSIKTNVIRKKYASC
jgi:hypothetical protein